SRSRSCCSARLFAIWMRPSKNLRASRAQAGGIRFFISSYLSWRRRFWSRRFSESFGRWKHLRSSFCSARRSVFRFIQRKLIALVMTAVPTVLLVAGTFMKLFGFFNIPQPWTLDNWRATLTDPVLVRSVWNTIAIGVGSGAVGILLYSVIAHVIVKTNHRGGWLLDFLSWLPWSIPGILLGVALMWTFLQTRIFLPIYGTIYVLMIAMVIKSMPLGTQLIKSVFLQLGNDLEEASKVCGGTWLDTFRRVIFPLTMPALITVGLISFISAARDISTVVLLGTGKSRTLSLLMLDFAAGAEFEKATVIAVIIVGLVVGSALFARRLRR